MDTRSKHDIDRRFPRRESGDMRRAMVALGIAVVVSTALTAAFLQKTSDVHAVPADRLTAVQSMAAPGARPDTNPPTVSTNNPKPGSTPTGGQKPAMDWKNYHKPSDQELKKELT